MKKIILAIICLLLGSGSFAQVGPIPGFGPLLSGPPASPPTHFFWAAAGSDGNNCQTIVTPCLTITHFNAFSFPANAVVSFNGGDTFSGGLTNFTTGMTVQSYGTGQAIISSGNSAACAAITDIAGVAINNISCVGGGNTTSTTDGIIFKNDQAGNTTLNGATATNNTITGYGRFGILLNGNNGTSGWNNFTFNGNTIHDVTGHSTGVTTGEYTSCIGTWTSPGYGLTLNAFSNGTINNNTLFNCTGTTAGNGGILASGSGISTLQATNVVVSNNVIHDYGVNNPGCGGDIGIWTTDANNITIQFNEIYNGFNGGGASCDGEAIDIDGDTINSTVQYNYAHNMKQADATFLLCGCNFTANSVSPTVDNITFRFNLIVANTVETIAAFQITKGNNFLQNITNAHIYNNTIIGPYNASVIGVGGPNGIVTSGTIANNILFAFGSNSFYSLTNTGDSTVVIAGNDYYSLAGNTFSAKVKGATYTSLGAFQAAGFEKVGGTPVGTTASPGLVFQTVYTVITCGGYTPATCPIQFRLTGGSPMLPNAGLDINADFSINPGAQDFYGTAITSATLPIGAAAVTGVATPANTTVAFDPSQLQSLTTLTNSNLTGTNSLFTAGHENHLIIPRSHSGGKLYAEFTANAAALGASTNVAFGLAPSLTPETGSSSIFLGHQATEMGAYLVPGTGIVMFTNGATAATYSYTINSSGVFQMAVDLTNNLIWVNVNNGNWNANASANPATGVGGLSMSIAATQFVETQIDLTNASITANFGATPYAFTPPAGFGNW